MSDRFRPDAIVRDAMSGISLRFIREYDAKADMDLSGFTVTAPPEWLKLALAANAIVINEKSHDA